MTIAFDDLLSVHYSQAYVVSGDEGPDPVRAFAGQVNGLCGAQVPGALFLVTGLHTGKVGFRVEVVAGPPALDEWWEEIVEVSFTAASPEVSLMDWHERMYPLPLAQATSYRVRYCARSMDAGKTFTADAGDDAPSAVHPVDTYQLTFWPASPEPDRIIRQTSRIAAYWHRAGFASGS